MKIAQEIYRNPSHTPIKESVMKDLLSGLESGEIEISRMVEILNCLASTQIDSWKRYAEDYETWSNKKHTDYMEKMMTKPNMPGYFRANND